MRGGFIRITLLHHPWREQQKWGGLTRIFEDPDLIIVTYIEIRPFERPIEPIWSQ